MIWYDTIFIYCNWVSTRWQWSVNLHKNRRSNTQKIQKHRIHNIENSCAPENRSCPKVVTGKWLLEIKKKSVEDAKNETWTYHKFKTTKKTMNSDRRDHTHKTQNMYHVADISTGRTSFNKSVLTTMCIIVFTRSSLCDVLFCIACRALRVLIFNIAYKLWPGAQPPPLLVQWVPGFFPWGQSGRGVVVLAIHPHLVARLKKE